VIELALQAGLKVAYNPAPMRADVGDLPLASLSLLVLNETEATALAQALQPGCEKADEAGVLQAQMPKTRIVLTLGARGAKQWLSGNRIDAAARKVDAVDTTGAGDTFVGYLLAALIDGFDDAKALDRACAAAALSVMRVGATPSIPAATEVDAFS